MNDKAKNLMLVVVVAVGIGFLLFANSENRGRTGVAMEYSQFLSDVNAGRVEKVFIDGSAIAIHLTDGNSASTYSPEADNGPLIKDLLDNHVSIEARPPQHQSVLMQLFISWFPMLLLIAVWIFFMRQMQGGMGGRGAMSFGKSRARLMGEDQVTITFSDVAGVE
ncbi:MAG: ATP-dependent metallopeptidase FtsH/Yme1/Tma family protein, partial [Gammaproteobacteria bacterium]